MTVQGQAAGIAARMRADMLSTFAQHLGEPAAAVLDRNLLEALVDDGMFPIEHLLVDLQDCRAEVETLRGEIESMDVPRV